MKVSRLLLLILIGGILAACGTDPIVSQSVQCQAPKGDGVLVVRCPDDNRVIPPVPN